MTWQTQGHVSFVVFLVVLAVIVALIVAPVAIEKMRRK